MIRKAYQDALRDDPDLGNAFRADLVAVYDRDPATSRFIDPLLYFKGFHAIQTHRLAHWLYRKGRKDFAYYLQSRSSAVFQVDINPAARMGRGIFLDHATGFVVGETAVIEDDVSILHGVTLGGTGKENEDRHPKIGRGVMIGAGAKILGNIEVGHCARIAAGSVVVKPVPNNVTVAGVPAKVVGAAGCAEPSRTMDQMLNAIGALIFRLFSAASLQTRLADRINLVAKVSRESRTGRRLWTFRKSGNSTPILKRLFGNPKIRVVPRPKKDNSAEVYIGEEFVGVLFVDDEDDDRSYQFQMAILEEDLADVG